MISFDVAYSRYAESLLDHARRLCARRGLRDEAPDVAQHVWMCAWRDWSTLDPERDPWPWLYTILHHKTVDLFRKGWGRRRVRLREQLATEVESASGGDADRLAPDTGPQTMERLAAEWEGWDAPCNRSLPYRRWLHEIGLGGLTDRQRAYVEARLSGLSLAQIAERDEMTEGGVAAGVHRAVAALKQLAGSTAPRRGE